MNKINIISNGSKWAGEEPDNLETLHKRLKTEPLDIATFATYGFVDFKDDRDVAILGNFTNISAVFRLEGSKTDLQPTIDLIQKNIEKQMEV